MSHYLVYLSEVILKNATHLNLIAQALNKIGTLRMADFNIYVFETAEAESTVHNTIGANAADNANFFVTTVKDISFKGSLQFGSTLALLEPKAPANFNRPIEYPRTGIV